VHLPSIYKEVIVCHHVDLDIMVTLTTNNAHLATLPAHNVLMALLINVPDVTVGIFLSTAQYANPDVLLDCTSTTVNAQTAHRIVTNAKTLLNAQLVQLHSS
jgi:hypothetical protein